MQFEQAATIVKDIPGPKTHPRRGRILYRHIRQNRPQQVLELGTARGGSAVFITAALEANGAGHLTTVESRRWMRTDPSPHEVLERAGLRDWVTLDATYSTYTWFLKSEIEKHLRPDGSVEPAYDLIFLDGAKNWSIDGLAVVLMEKLLRPSGWLLLDDLGWNYSTAVKRNQHYSVEIAALSEPERDEPHLRAIFDLLIKTNPVFDKFEIQDDWWGWAHKSTDAAAWPGGALAGSRPARVPAPAKAAAPSASQAALRTVWQRLPAPVQQPIRKLRSAVAGRRR